MNDCHICSSTNSVNKIIENAANKNNIPLVIGNTLCSECFDYYVKDIYKLMKTFPENLNIIAAEMEAFALFYTAKYLDKKAACLLSVVDSHYRNEQISSDEREKSLNNMIKIALEAACEL